MAGRIRDVIPDVPEAVVVLSAVDPGMNWFENDGYALLLPVRRPGYDLRVDGGGRHVGNTGNGREP